MKSCTRSMRKDLMAKKVGKPNGVNGIKLLTFGAVHFDIC